MAEFYLFRYRSLHHMKRGFAGILCAALLTGCGAIRDSEINRAPDFSSVRADLGYTAANSTAAYPPQPAESKYSLYRANGQNFYRDPRAVKPGDVLTVLISINDSASLKNKTDAKRDADTSHSADSDFSLISKSIGGNINTASSSNSKGDAKVERNENIRLSVAAIVTNVLPNGNLVINGSQEVRVNQELRILNVVGVVRPRDISGNNTISYDKIAEARVSYGGRGRMSEVQSPPWGQQILNRAMPF